MIWLKWDINRCLHLGLCIIFQTIFSWVCASNPRKRERRRVSIRKMCHLPKKKIIFLCKCSVHGICENSLTQLISADWEDWRLNNIFASITGQRGRPGRAFNGQPGKEGERGHVGRPGLRGHAGLRGPPGVCMTSGCAQLNPTSGTPQPAPRRLRNRQ